MTISILIVQENLNNNKVNSFRFFFSNCKKKIYYEKLNILNPAFYFYLLYK